MAVELIRAILAFALLGFMTWLWSQVMGYITKTYLAPVINTEFVIKRPKGVIA